MKHQERLLAAVLLSDDKYPGWVLIHPFPGMYVPAMRDELLILPPGERGLVKWYSSEADGWAWVAEQVAYVAAMDEAAPSPLPLTLSQPNLGADA